MDIKHTNKKGVTTIHIDVKTSKCGKYIICSNNFTKLKASECKII